MLKDSGYHAKPEPVASALMLSSYTVSAEACWAGVVFHACLTSQLIHHVMVRMNFWLPVQVIGMLHQSSGGWHRTCKCGVTVS